jgi:hypothetical protein
MKIIFLDVDGVLNYSRMDKDDHIETPSGLLSKRCVGLFNEITNRTGAKIVVSSTWRLDGISVFDSLKAGGVTGEFIGLTGRGCRCCLRGNEIRQWISDNKDIIGCQSYDFDSYVIIDDDSDMLLWQQNNFFNTDHFVGLTEKTVYKVCRFLGENKKPSEEG